MCGSSFNETDVKTKNETTQFYRVIQKTVLLEIPVSAGLPVTEKVLLKEMWHKHFELQTI